ncbi:MAG TPA: tetratricopeptide repeat protein [bacterium]|nr:tetratricopeptide repeat protein [Candidatus Omnitrophota bacterium]HOL94172.1 tetratricopeptide repeat protein [bacterium]HPP00078.1 tetratricopeptide repeat protein [bacterium]
MTPSKMDHKDLQRRLKEDELSLFLEESREKLEYLWTTYGRKIGLAAAFVAVAVAAMYFWRVRSAADYESAQLLYGNATAWIEQNQYDLALQELDKLLKEHPRSPVAALGYVLRGDLRARMGDYTNAMNDYIAALPKLPKGEAIQSRITIALIQTYRSLGRTDDALRELESLEKTVKSPSMKNQIAYLKGGVYEDKNDPAKALECYKSVPMESEWYSLALERVRWLEAEAVGAINS